MRYRRMIWYGLMVVAIGGIVMILAGEATGSGIWGGGAAIAVMVWVVILIVWWHMDDWDDWFYEGKW